MSAANRKRVRILLSIETTLDVPADWGDELIRFHAEESYCVDNIIDSLHAEIKPGICNHCQRATVKVLGMP